MNYCYCIKREGIGDSSRFGSTRMTFCPLQRRPQVLKNVIMVAVPPKITGPRSSKDISITLLARVFLCVSFAWCTQITQRLSCSQEVTCTCGCVAEVMSHLSCIINEVANVLVDHKIHNVSHKTCYTESKEEATLHLQLTQAP